MTFGRLPSLRRCISQIVKPIKTNYKGIRLLRIVSLIFEKNITDFLYNKMKRRITPRQCGCQSRRSAVIQLIDFLEAFNLENSSNLCTVYLDYAKAFNRVSFQFLLRKILLNGHDENFTDLCDSYLSARYQIVRVQHEVSDPLPVLNGVFWVPFCALFSSSFS